MILPFRLGLMALMIVALPSALLAEAKPALPKGEWVVSMMKGEKDTFGYCLMRAPYDNGLALAIAMSAKQEINLGVQVPKAAYKKDDKYPMLVSIDKGAARKRVAVPVEADLLLTPMGPDKDILKALRKGKVLSMQGPQDTALFSLKGTGKGLAELQQCVDVGSGKIKPPTEKATARGKAPAFPPGLKQLLETAGLKKLEIVPVKDPEKAPVDFAWSTDGVFGGLRERPVPKEATIEKMTEVIESGYRKQCTGMFASDMGTIEKLKGIELRKSDISCQSGSETAHVALLLYRTDTGLFSMFMHEAPVARKADAAAARDRITDVIRQLAEKEPAKAAP